MKNPLSLRLLNRFAVLAGWPLILLAHSAIGAATPKYVQGNYAGPQTPAATVTVPYTGAQAAGDLNVVIVGWNGASALVSSLKDSKGNVYHLAVGPMVTGAFSQAIYYAKNISAAAAATNAVTVTFTAAATFPDIRILEYGGIDPANPVDTIVGAIGSSATSSSGSLRTTNAADLLLGANTVQTSVTGVGSGFTLRLLTVPDGDIVEDRVVTATGSYSSTAPLNSAGEWVHEMVAFRAAGSATPSSTPTPTPLGYVQGNYAAPPTPQKTITVPYTAAQKTGDLNVVIVGWNDSTTQLTGFGDSKGNTYHLAVGPTVVKSSPSLSQVIVYASNIAAATAGANAVTLTFSAAATYPDVRILEYSGISASSPFDVAYASSGNSATSGSGSLTTKNASDLLVGANVVWTATTGPGSGFTKRLLTNDGDIVEDRIVTAAGSYSASAPLSSAGPWIMQMAAFRSASSAPAPTATPKPTPTPTPTPKPTATPTPTPVKGGTPTPLKSVTLSWSADPATSNPATNPTGYRVHWGTASGNYTQVTDVGNKTSGTVSTLISGTKYYFAVTAYNLAGVDGPPSNQVSYTAP